MKKYLTISIAINMLFGAFFMTAYFNNSQDKNNGFLMAIYERRNSFFDMYAIEKDDIVFLGDSLTDETEWSEIFGSEKIRNRGIWGDTSKGVLNRLDNIVEGQPAKIFLCVGANDILNDLAEEKILANIDNILKTIQSDSPETQVYLLSVFPQSAKRGNKIVSLNQKLLLLAEKKQVEFLNLHPHFSDSDGSLKKELSNDRLHLNALGYQQWVELIADQVKTQSAH